MQVLLTTGGFTKYPTSALWQESFPLLSASQALIISICSVSSPTCWDWTAETGAWNWTGGTSYNRWCIVSSGSEETPRALTFSWVQNPAPPVSSSAAAATPGSGARQTPCPAWSPWWRSAWQSGSARSAAAHWQLMRAAHNSGCLVSLQASVGIV